jgi:hypothetical protein
MAGWLPRRRHRHAGSDLIRRPDQRRIAEAGEREMKRGPVLRHRDALGQPRRHHRPAHRALHGAQRENAGEGSAEPAIVPAAPQEPQERQQELGSDQAAEQPAAPLPPEEVRSCLAACWLRSSDGEFAVAKQDVSAAGQHRDDEKAEDLIFQFQHLFSQVDDGARQFVALQPLERQSASNAPL